MHFSQYEHTERLVENICEWEMSVKPWEEAPTAFRGFQIEKFVPLLVKPMVMLLVKKSM